MTETIAVMFVFFILLVLAIVFYARIQTAGIITESEEQFIKKAIGISQIISFLPEVQCSQENVVKENCFDKLKLKGFNNVIASDNDNKLYYYDQFGFANITIYFIYPSDEPSITLYDNEKLNYPDISNPDYAVPAWKRITTFPTPISVYDPTRKRNMLGILMIKIYQ